MIGACLGFVLCSALQAGPLEKQQVPSGAKWVLHADVEAFLASKTGGFILDELNKSGLEQWTAVVKNAFGIDPSKDLQGVTVYGPDFEKDNGIVLVRAKMEQDKLLAVLKANKAYRESKHGDHVVHRWRDEPKGAEPGAIKFGCFHGKDLAVIAPSLDMLKLALGVLDEKTDSLAKVDAESTLLPAPAKGVFLTAALTDLPQVAKQDPKAGALALAESARLQVGESGEKVFVRLAVTAQTPKVAADLRKMAEGCFAFLSLVGQIEEDGKPAFPPVMAAVLKDLSADVRDRTVEVKAMADTRDVIALLQWMVEQGKAAEKAKADASAKPAPRK